MRYGNCGHGCVRRCFLFTRRGRWCGGENTVISNNQAGGGHSSYLHVEMIVLPGYGERIPEQKKQAERCRVKAIRWFCVPGGCYGHNDPFVPEWLLEEAARMSWLYCQMEIISRAGSEAGYRREPRKTWTARFIKFQRWHRTSPESSEDKTACGSRCSRHSYLHQGLSSTQQHQWPCTVPSLRKRGSLPKLDACALIPHKALMRAVQQSAWEMK